MCFVNVLFNSLESLFGEQRRRDSGVRPNESLKANFQLLPLKLKFTEQLVSRQPGMLWSSLASIPLPRSERRRWERGLAGRPGSTVCCNDSRRYCNSSTHRPGPADSVPPLWSSVLRPHIFLQPGIWWERCRCASSTRGGRAWPYYKMKAGQIAGVSACKMFSLSSASTFPLFFPLCGCLGEPNQHSGVSQSLECTRNKGGDCGVLGYWKWRVLQ